MSTNEDDDLRPTETQGYKLNAKKLTPEEIAEMDKEDESLQRWKASLGLTGTAVASADTSGPKMTVLSLELLSPTLPSNKSIKLDLTDTAHLADIKKNPVSIKEGVEYSVRIRFKGARYIQLVKRAGLKVDKLEQMLGSYGPQEAPYMKDFDPDESPTGMLARSGTYNVRSRVVDDDGEVHCDFEWAFKIAKEW